MIELARDIPIFRADRRALRAGRARGDPAHRIRRRRTPTTICGACKQLVELMGDLGFPGSVIEATDPAFQSAVWNVRKEGLNIMMSMKGDGKPVSFIEDCAVAARRPRRIHRPADRGLRQARHLRHLVRARLGRLPARAPGAQHEAGARAPRRCARSPRKPSRWCANTRARIPASTATASCAPNFTRRCSGRRIVRAFEEVKDSFDPDRAVQPRQDRAPAEDGRPLAVPLQARLPAAAARHRARLVGMGQLRQRRRDVQQQRRLPQIRPRRDVPVLSRHRRRAASDARPRQHAAPRPVRPARRRRAGLGRDAPRRWRCASRARAAAANARPASTWRDEDRVPAPLQASATGYRLRDRAVAYLPRYAPYAARLAPLLNLRNRVRWRLGERCSAQRSALASRGLTRAARHVCRGTWCDTRCHGELGRPARPPPHRTAHGAGARSCCWSTPSTAISSRRTPRRRAGADARRLSGDDARAGGRPAALLRPHLPRRRPGRRGAGRRRGACSTRSAPAIAAGTPIIGLEPSCLLTLRDEFPAMLPGAETAALAAHAQLFEEFVASERSRRPLRICALARDAGQDRAAARPLPSEGVRHRRRGGRRAAADPGARGRDLRFDLLRHGRRRSATRPSITSCR